MGKLNKIVIHWSAGSGVVNATELEHYHYVIDSHGLIHSGKFKPEDNENCQDGKYAAHCGGGNTGAIGVAVSGMASYDSKLKRCANSSHELRPVQMEAMYSLVATLCKKYNIPTKNVITHAEFGSTHPKTESAGKIDITAIPCSNVYGLKACGDFIRNKVDWYRSKK